MCLFIDADMCVCLRIGRREMHSCQLDSTNVFKHVTLIFKCVCEFLDKDENNSLLGLGSIRLLIMIVLKY